MKIIKRLIFILLICLCFLFVGCKDDSNPEKKDDTQGQTEDKKDDNQESQNDKKDDTQGDKKEEGGTQEGGTGWLPWV